MVYRKGEVTSFIGCIALIAWLLSTCTLFMVRPMVQIPIRTVTTGSDKEKESTNNEVKAVAPLLDLPSTFNDLIVGCSRTNETLYYEAGIRLLRHETG